MYFEFYINKEACLLLKKIFSFAAKILVRILLIAHMNTFSVLQRKLPSSCFSPSICPFCLQHGEDPIHLFFLCQYSAKCWETLFSIFNTSCVFKEDRRDLVRQLLGGPCFDKTSRYDLMQ